MITRLRKIIFWDTYHTRIGEYDFCSTRAFKPIEPKTIMAQKNYTIDVRGLEGRGKSLFITRLLGHDHSLRHNSLCLNTNDGVYIIRIREGCYTNSDAAVIVTNYNDLVSPMKLEFASVLKRDNHIPKIIIYNHFFSPDFNRMAGSIKYRRAVGQGEEEVITDMHSVNLQLTDSKEFRLALLTLIHKLTNNTSIRLV